MSSVNVFALMRKPATVKAGRGMRRSTIIVLLAACLAAVGFQASWAAEDDYPAKPIQLIVPFAPGGSLDITARIVGQKLKDYLGQPIVVINKPGAGSAVGARALASAAPAPPSALFTCWFPASIMRSRISRPSPRSRRIPRCSR